MSHLVVPKVECVETKDNHGRFVAEPLEKGLGLTLGNAMRRVLLGYLPGAAVTQIRIEGIQHEFSTIPNVKEDATDFILNVKTLRLKPVAGRPGKLTLEVAREGAISAADIQPSNDFEIANPDLHLATLDSSESKLHVEFEVGLGVGYKQAESGDNLPIGTIPIDAIFTPVRKVNFTVEPILVGRETSRERLSLEIWTDGTVTPVDALSRAAGILIEQTSPFVEYAKVSQKEEGKDIVRLSIPEEKYNMPVEQLDLSVRTMNCLRRAGVTTVGEVMSKGRKELLSLRNFGQKSLEEIEARLSVLGLSFPSEEESSHEA